jgi:Na+/proline symporter
MTAVGRAAKQATASLGLSLVLLAGVAGAAAACPSCKQALDTSDRWQSAFNASVLFMMSMPFAVVAVVAGAVYRAHRRKRMNEAPAEAPPAA